MLGRLYEGQACSAARSLEVIGERWSLLIVRNALYAGMTRFTDFQRSLGIAPNVLSKRLADFVEAGLFEQRDGPSGTVEYVLTEKGRDLQPVVVALTEWGDRWAAAPEGRPVTYVHSGCGGEVALALTCSGCGGTPSAREVEAEVAPWARPHHASVPVVPRQSSQPAARPSRAPKARTASRSVGGAST